MKTTETQSTEDLLKRIAISNPLYTLRILEGDESYEYWLDRILDTETSKELRGEVTCN